MGEILVLCYHALSERFPASLSVSPDAFREQLGVLMSRGYRGETFSDAISEPPEGKVLAVTFDDAYRSVVRLALPIMAEYELPGTVFAPTSYIGSDGPMNWPGIDEWHGTSHETELVPCSWSELGQLLEAGWEVGSHTRTHPRLPELPDSELMTELSESRLECERHLGAPCRSIAYPYGAVDARVADAVAAAGYSFAAELPGNFSSPPVPLRWPRVGIYNRDRRWRFQLKTAKFMRELRGTAAWSIVDGARQVRRHT